MPISPEEWEQVTLRVPDLMMEQSIPDRIVLCEQASCLDVIRCAVNNQAQHIVLESNPHWETEMHASLIMMRSPQCFLNRPLATILSPENATEEQEIAFRQFDITFSKSEERTAALEALEIFLKSRTRRKSFISSVLTSADELFSNVIYDAPFAQSGPVNRDEAVTLPEPKYGRISVGVCSNRLALVCEDSFGTLDVRELLFRLEKCYERGLSEAMNWSTGGAGIGSYFVFENAIAAYYGVWENHKTIVATVYPIEQKPTAELSKCLHYLIV